MEQLTGDITAVGSVTMEAGSKIGNSLRTIYSRVTTMPDATALLEEFGIAIYEMGASGPQVREVGEILGALGGKWKELNSEQQQAIGLAIAGRSRLTQFLALMNNYGTSIDATTTAYNAQGSAMQEQRAYMSSYEYQMTVMKATASELALTMEDQLVGDAMYLVISVGTDMLEVLNSLFETFGVLTTITGIAGTGLLLFSSQMQGAVSKLGVFIANSGALPGLMSKLTTSIGGMTGAVTGLSTAGTILVGGGLVLGIMGIVAVIEKLISAWADARRAQEEAKVAMDEALTSFNGQNQDISKLVDRYEELALARKGSADALSVEEEREYQDIVNQISTILPSTVSHIDAQGQAHLQNADNIRKEVDSMQALADENQKLIASNTPTILKEQSEAYDELNDLLEKNAIYTDVAKTSVEERNEEVKKTKELQESENVIMRTLGDTYAWFDEITGKAGKAQEQLFETQSNDLATKYQLKELIQETTLVLGEQTTAMLDSDGKMGNMSSSAETLLANFSSYQSSLLENVRNQEEWDLATQKITETNLEFGEVLGKVYDDLAEGMDGIDPTKAIESMDMLVNSLPDEFFAQSTAKMQSDLEALSGTVSTVMSGADVDVDALVQTLINAGVESGIAISTVKDLGITFENQSIKSAVAEEELSDYNEELIKTRDIATEAINPLEQLFGFSSEEVTSMNSRLAHLQLLQEQYGETWSTMDAGQESITELATFFGQSEEFVIQNLDSIGKAFNALGGVTTEWSTESQKNVWKFDESVDEQTKTFLMSMLEQGDGFSTFVQEFAQESGVVVESQEKMEERTTALNEKFKLLAENPLDTSSYNNLVNEISSQLNDLDGTFSTVTDSAGNLKFVMADGTESEFLANLNTQITNSGFKVTETVDELTGLKKAVITGPTGDELLTIASMNQQAESGDLAIEKLKETYEALKDETTSEEDRETYIAVLQTQMESFGENIRTVTDDQGNLKLEFADGTTSPWLEALNGMIGETGLKLEETTDKLGKVNYVLKDPNGNILFESAKTDAETLNAEVDKSKTKVDELKMKAGTASKINLDGTEANGTIDGAKLKYDEFISALNPEGEKPKMGLDGTPAGEELDGVKLKYDNLLGKIKPETGSPTINLDGSPARSEVDGVKGSIDELDNNNVDLKIDPASIGTFNEAVDKLKYAQEEVKTAEQRLELLKADIALTGNNLSTIMENIGTISNAQSAIQNLLDKTKEARAEMGLLYDAFANAQINTSGITSSATVISDEATKIKNSFEDIKTKISEVNISIAKSTVVFDVSPIVGYRLSVQSNMALSIQSFASLATSVPVYMNIVNQALKFNTEGLSNARTTIGIHLNAISRMFDEMANNGASSLSGMSFRITGTFLNMSSTLSRQSAQLRQNVYANISGLSKDSVERFIRFVNDFINYAKKMNEATVYQATRMKEAFTTKISEMSRNSMGIFYDMANDMVAVASNLPSRIGNGIRQNMADASSAMNDLADNMVNRFKKALGIHSPSRVFYNLGGHVIDGLVNGLGDKDLKSLGKDVFNDFGGGIFDTWDMIKAYVSGDFSNIAGSGSVQAFAGTAMKALMMTGQYSQGNLEKLLMQMQSESGGNAKAINLWDSNAKAGIPSKGLMQVIDPTFQAYAMDGYDTNIWDPLSNILASIRYALSRYGSLSKAYRGVGYANGGFIDEMELAWHGEEGPEAIIPLIPQRRERGLDLWAETGEKLGLDEKIIRLLTASQKRTSAFNGVTSFAGLDGEAGASSGDASGTSGVIKPDYSSISRSLGLGNEPMFSGFAGNELESLYKRDNNEVSINRHTAMVTKANTELTALTEQTLKYRNALKEVTEQETRLRNAKQKELTDTVKRQAQIEKELSKLQKTSKHTEAQRKKYNALQQEFDQNTQSIYSLENEVRQLNIAMSDRKVEIYTDYIGQLTTGYQELRDAISETIQDMQFGLDKLALTKENDVGGQLKIQYNILKETMRLESTLRNNMNSLQSEYSKAVSKYGKNSKQALLVKEELASVEDDYQASVLNTIKLEQEIEKAREDVANEGIESLKSYYSQTQAMTERAIDLERKSLEKAHKDKMSLYDEEIAKIESVYDTRLQEMDAEEAESEYQKTISDLNTQRADLMSQISRASRDTTLEGKKRLADLQTELATVNEEVSTTQKDRQDELYREAIEAQKEQQIAEIELSKEKAESEQVIALESLDKQLASAKKYSDDIINDESMWNNLMERFVAGDTTPLAEMMNEMQGEMARYMSGDYSGISMGYGELSDEDKALFSEDTLLEISNLMFNASESMERFVSTANTSVQNIGNVGGQSYNAGQETTWRGSNLVTKGQTGPTIKAPPAPKPIVTKPKADNRYYTIKNGDTLWDLAQKYYGNPYKWTTIANANKNPDPRKLQIGRKLLIPFKSGGATGDWVGDEGRLAILHKKELVLNEAQTSDILNVAKIVDKISGTIPKIKAQRANVNNKEISRGETYIIDNLTMSLEGFTGTKEDARRAFDVMAKELKKKGK